MADENSRKLDAIITGIMAMADAVENNTKVLLALNAWLREPGGSDLPDTLTGIAKSLQQVEQNTGQIIDMIDRLP